tara:strand:+ start:268 stop:498 length:231 start_codon:yes stop_codon:yes gene_type:complete
MLSIRQRCLWLDARNLDKIRISDICIAATRGDHVVEALELLTANRGFNNYRTVIQAQAQCDNTCQPAWFGKAITRR